MSKHCFCSLLHVYSTKCLHAEPCANQQRKTDLSGSAIKTLPSCNFFCSKDETYTYEKAPGVWKSTKQPHPRCKKHGKLAKMHVVKNLLKSNYGRPFFVCSDQTNPCSFDLDLGRCTTRRCNYFEWVPEEPYCNAKLTQAEIKQNDKREEQYPTENFINDPASLKSCF